LNKFLSELKRRNVLRVALLYLLSAWLIAQVADVVTGLGGLPLAVGRSVLIILAVGFPVAMVLAWIFEWTPAGIRRETEAAEAPAAEPARGRGMDYVIMSLLSVALVYFIATHDWHGSRQSVAASIAVLPFENRSSQPDDLFFAEGMHDDLLTQLGKISSLVVISRTSVEQYRDSAKAVPEIARELGVANILEGGVQRAGNRVRINLQLIDAATDRHLWAETYDRELSAENVFAIQSEIATTIADVLHATLLPDEKARIETVPTQSLEAYDAYLLGRRALAIRTEQGFIDAADYFSRAIELDPVFALAYAGLADAKALRVSWGWDNGNGDELLAGAEQAARKALELNPELGEAQASYGALKQLSGAKPSEFLPYLQRAIELAPGYADARKWYANYLASSGRNEEALAQLQRAAVLDPLSAIIRVNLGRQLEDLGRDDEARTVYLRALEIEPGLVPALSSAGSVVNLDQALVAFSRVYAAGKARELQLLFCAMTYLALSDDARAEQWIAHIERIAPGSLAALLTRMHLSVYRGRQAEALAAAAGFVKFERQWSPEATRLMALQELRGGDPEAARRRFAEKFPAMFSDEPGQISDYGVAIDIAVVLDALGESERAARLLDLSLASINTLSRAELRDEGIVKARVYAVKGDRVAALDALQAAIDAGWPNQWRDYWQFYMEQDASLDGIRDDPRFGAMADAIRTDVARQLALVREHEASGEIVLPPGPD